MSDAFALPVVTGEAPSADAILRLDCARISGGDLALAAEIFQFVKSGVVPARPTGDDLRPF